jgi:SsrA-binding protein
MAKKVVATNRKAFHDYSILEKFEAGIVLTGYEVKSLRQGNASLVDGLVSIKNGEAFMENVYIPPYINQSTHIFEYNPRHKRKLLLHKQEIHKLSSKTREKGFSIVPLEIYFSDRNIAKTEIGLAKGKKTYDKREVKKRKDIDRDMQRELHNR